MYRALIVFLSMNTSFAGHEDGNGGDTVYCTKSNENKFVGYYSLDQVLARDAGEASSETLAKLVDI